MFSTVGVFSTVRGYHEYRGDIMSTVGDIMSTIEDMMSIVGAYLEHRGECSVLSGYRDKCGGYLEYRGSVKYCGGHLEYRRGCSVPWGDIIIHVRDIMSANGACLVPWGISSGFQES